MIATKTMMRTTPPTIPPMTGARGNLCSPPFESACIGFVGEVDGLLDGVVEVEEMELVVVERVSDWVEDWKAKGQKGKHGKEFVYSQGNQSEWLLSPLWSIFLRVTRMSRWVVKGSVQ